MMRQCTANTLPPIPPSHLWPHLGDLERLDLAGVPDVRTATEVDQRATPVGSGGRRLHPLLQDPHLELVVAEHLQQVFLGDLEPFERLLLLDGGFHY